MSFSLFSDFLNQNITNISSTTTSGPPAWFCVDPVDARTPPDPWRCSPRPGAMLAAVLQDGSLTGQTGRKADGFRQWNTGEWCHTGGRHQGQGKTSGKHKATNHKSDQKIIHWIQVKLNKRNRVPASSKNTSTRLLKNISFYCSWKSSQKVPLYIYAAHEQNILYLMGLSSAEKNQLSSVKKPGTSPSVSTRNRIFILGLSRLDGVEFQWPSHSEQAFMQTCS